MSVARFKFYGRIDGATSGTVEIDRSTGLVSVRPARRHRTYALPLDWVARAVLERVVRSELAEKRREKRLVRRGR